MKKLNLILLAVLTSITVFTSLAQPKRELRSAWIAVMANIDWPSASAKGTNAINVAAQKSELTSILDAMQHARMNAAYFHARIMCDATYPSNYAPWAHYLVGTRGANPGWDPMAFFVEESHKRGMQAIAWLNPYRYSDIRQFNSQSMQDLLGWNTSYDTEMKKHLIHNNKGYYTLNPADEWSINHIKNVVRELIENYDIDGIIFDDYFYPNHDASDLGNALYIEGDGDTADYNDYKSKGGTMSLNDWRRSNVNHMVKEVNDLIQSIDPKVSFGISPAGIAGSSSTSASLYPEVGGANPVNSDWQYNQINSDPLAWLKAQTIDYISPQLYWGSAHISNPFGPVTKWWSHVANVFGRHHYASHDITYTSNKDLNYANSSTFGEMNTEVDFNRNYSENNAPGHVLYSVKYVRDYPDFQQYLRDNVFTRPALRPVMTWKAKGNYSAPAGLALNGNTLSWDKVTSDRGAQYAVYAIPNNVMPAKSKGSDGIKGDYLIAAPYGNSVEIPSQYRNGYWFAVTAIDAAGNEYEPTTINEPDPTVIPDIVPSLASIESQSKWTEVWRNNSYIDNARNLCYGDGKVFVATTDGKIHVLDAKTGTHIKDLNVNGVNGGYFGVCGVQYRNGKIYAANLTIAPSTTPIKVYCWNSIDAAPTIVLNTTTSEIARAGDHFGMTDNYFYFVNGNKALRYRIGTTTMQKTTLPVTLGSSPHIDPVDDNSFWVTSTSNNPIRYNWVTNGTATQAESTGGILGNTRGVGFAPFTMSSGYQFAFIVDYLTDGSYQNGCANLIRKQNGSWNTGANVHLPQGGLSSTANTTTSSSIAVNLQDANGTTTAVDMWILVTNQGIAHYTAGAEDSYASDGIGRYYRIPGSGPYAGKKLMELTLPGNVGTFRLSCKKDMQYGIDVSGDSKENDADVIIYKTSQTFEITHRGDGYCTISRNGNCLTIQGNPPTVSNGNNILMYEYNGGTNQLWKFVRNDDGSYTIISKKNKDFVLDVNGGTMENSTNVQLYTSNNSDAQKWILEPVGNAAIPYYAVPDSYFQKFLIEKGYARIYNENSHQITGTATLGANFDTNAKAGTGEHVVILPETIAALTEFNGLGEYGDEKPYTTTDGKSYTQFEGVNNLKGIEYFTELKKLDMCRAKFGINSAIYGGVFSVIQDGEINLQYNTKLEYIDLDFSGFKDFNQTGIKNLKNLKYLNINNNADIKSIDISQLESLEQLNTDHCFELTQIDAAHNENMKVLSIFDTMYGWKSNYSLQKLVDNFPNLEFLYAYATYNTELDMSRHTKLMSLWVHNSIYGTRQKAKGNWLHKLDLSGCTELRDIHVENMHLSALNIPSTHLGEDFPEEYRDLKIGRDIGENATPHGGTPPHWVNASNNYRHIKPNLVKWTVGKDADTKSYYMYYLRIDGNAEDNPIEKKQGWYKIYSYDTYVGDNNTNNRSSEKEIKLDCTLKDDLFEVNKILLDGWKVATIENKIESLGVMNHVDGSTPLCVIADGVAYNEEVVNAEVLNSIKSKIKGTIVVLKAGVGDASPVGAPGSVSYGYNIVDVNSAAGSMLREAAEPMYVNFYFDLDYSPDGVVTGIESLGTSKEVASVKYYNVAGQESVIPFRGVNIVKITYTDGTTAASKVIK